MQHNWNSPRSLAPSGGTQQRHIEALVTQQQRVWAGTISVCRGTHHRMPQLDPDCRATVRAGKNMGVLREKHRSAQRRYRERLRAKHDEAGQHVEELTRQLNELKASQVRAAGRGLLRMRTPHSRWKVPRPSCASCASSDACCDLRQQATSLPAAPGTMVSCARAEPAAAAQPAAGGAHRGAVGAAGEPQLGAAAAHPLTDAAAAAGPLRLPPITAIRLQCVQHTAPAADDLLSTLDLAIDNDVMIC